MTVEELSRDQLDELKWTYFYSDDYDQKITTAAGLPVLFAGDIPDAIIYAVYAGLEFVPEDFICTVGRETEQQHLYRIYKEKSYTEQWLTEQEARDPWYKENGFTVEQKKVRRSA